MPRYKLKNLSDQDILEFAIITKYLRYMLLVYGTDTMNMFGKSKKISKKIVKISDDFDIYKSDCENYLWSRLEDMKYKGVFNKSLQEIFYGEENINKNLITKFIEDIIGRKFSKSKIE